MIHIFNKTELTRTNSLLEVNNIRNLLSTYHVEYKIKTNVAFAASSARGGRTGDTPGLSRGAELFTIYVRRADLEYAKNLIKFKI